MKKLGNPPWWMGYSLLLIFCSVLMSVCIPTEEEKRLRSAPRPEDNGHELTSSIRYFKDHRPATPLCFAYMWRGDQRGGPAMSEVACTPDIERLLINPKPPANGR